MISVLGYGLRLNKQRFHVFVTSDDEIRTKKIITIVNGDTLQWWNKCDQQLLKNVCCSGQIFAKEKKKNYPNMCAVTNFTPLTFWNFH